MNYEYTDFSFVVNESEYELSFNIVRMNDPTLKGTKAYLTGILFTLLCSDGK